MCALRALAPSITWALCIFVSQRLYMIYSGLRLHPSPSISYHPVHVRFNRPYRAMCRQPWPIKRPLLCGLCSLHCPLCLSDTEVVSCGGGVVVTVVVAVGLGAQEGLHAAQVGQQAGLGLQVLADGARRVPRTIQRLEHTPTHTPRTKKPLSKACHADSSMGTYTPSDVSSI